MASEMLYPVMPLYLREIGFGMLAIGLLEGITECIVGLSKGYFGQQSDRTGRRLPFVRAGYLLSALAKPLTILFVQPLWVFFIRSAERLGKGIRTAPRDALLAAAATPSTRARVFSFHRGWDTAGAMLGPLLALLWLNNHPASYRPLFYFALLPGLLAVLLLFFIREKGRPAGDSTKRSGGFFSFFSYWKIAGAPYKQLVIGLLLFTLANSSDAFLLLRARAITGSDTLTISAYILYNLVYALAAYPMGILADRMGMKKVFIAGIFIFILVYLGFALCSSSFWIFILFALYGLYAASTEGIAKAWLVNVLRDNQTGTAIGLFTSLQSLGGLAASSLAGLIWTAGGASPVFLFSAILACIALLYLSRLRMQAA